MVSVLSILIWIVVIVGIVKGFSGNDSKKTQPTQNSTQKTVQQFKSGAQKIISEISAYADAAEQGTSTGNKTSYNQTQRSYNAQQKAAAKSAQPTNIVDRAKQNANKYTEDTTLEQLEKEHKHSERESKAEAAYVAKEREEHRKLHTEPIPPVEEESLLGSVQDLMIKGYDGNLSFERDFVGEAMDLLNSFTVQ